MLNWNYLETFVLLSENLSFSETAELLKTSQPSVSRQIRFLEESLGYPLFIRSRKNVILSKEGLQLKLKLTPLVSEIKKIILIQKELSSSIADTFRIGSMHEAGQILLMPIIRKFLKLHSQVNIHTTLMSSASICEEVLKGNLDFGFVYQLSESKTLKAFKVIEDRPVLLQSTKSKLLFEERKCLDFISYRENDAYTKQFIEKNLTKIEQKRVRFRSSVNSHSVMLQMIAEEDLLCVIPHGSAAESISKNQTKIIKENLKSNPLYLICHEQTFFDKRKKYLFEFLIQEFKKIDEVSR